MSDKIKETKTLIWKLIRSDVKGFLIVATISMGIVVIFPIYWITKLTILASIFIITMFISMIASAIKEIKEITERITPPLSKAFDKIPEDLILENHEELLDIENLNGDLNYTLKQKLVSLSNREIEHWGFYVRSSNLQGNPINLKAYKIDSTGEVVRDPSFKVESIQRGKDTQIFLIDFLTSKSPEIEFMIEYSLNRLFPALFTSGEYTVTTFPRRVKKYKIEIKLPKGIKKIERCCITKTAGGGGVIENGCYLRDSEGLVPVQETCYPHSQLSKEISIDNEDGRQKIVLESESGLNKEDSVKIWWLCS